MIFLVLWVFMTLRLSCYWPRSQFKGFDFGIALKNDLHGVSKLLLGVLWPSGRNPRNSKSRYLALWQFSR